MINYSENKQCQRACKRANGWLDLAIIANQNGLDCEIEVENALASLELTEKVNNHIKSYPFRIINLLLKASNDASHRRKGIK